MIAKQSKGRGFTGTVRYVIEKYGARLIGGNMLGETADEIASEFSASRKLRPNLERAVYHTSLSLPVGEKLGDEKWAAISEQYLTKMGFEKSQYMVVRHNDTEHDHVHIVASRIGLDGGYVRDSQDYQRSEEIVRGLEIEHGLTRVVSSREVDRRAPTRGEIEMASRGDVSTKLQLQGLIDAAIDDKPTMSKFIERMEATGVGVKPNIAKTGHVSGVSFTLDGEQMKGGDLGRGYTWMGLQKRGVNYEQERDRTAISRSCEQAAGIKARRDDRELEQARVVEGRGVNREDRAPSRRDGQGIGLDIRYDDGSSANGKEGYDRDGHRDGAGQMGGKTDRGPGRSDDLYDLGRDVNRRMPHLGNRGNELRALARALRPPSVRSGRVEGIQSTVPGLKSWEAKRALKNLGLGAKEVGEKEIEQKPIPDGLPESSTEGPPKKNRSQEKSHGKKDPFSFDIGDNKRSRDSGPDFFGF